jgi:riboflavin synthase
VESIRPTATGRRISILSSTVAAGAAPGSSVAVNGVCLSVVRCAPPVSKRDRARIEADILQRTWEVTNLSLLKPRDKVNLEPALRMGDRLGGHFVLGHVDGRGSILSRAREGGDVVLGISVGRELERGLVPRGSVAVDGVSLTVARVESGIFYVHCILLTLQATTLGARPVGSMVNLEIDVLGKYTARERESGITEEFLREHGMR